MRKQELSTRIRNFLMAHDYNEGMNTEELAKKYEISRSTVYHHLGLTTQYHPRPQGTRDNTIRNMQIVEALRAGIKVTTVAAQFGLTPRTIYDIGYKVGFIFPKSHSKPE